jgi:hypothetical protein
MTELFATHLVTSENQRETFSVEASTAAPGKFEAERATHKEQQ